MNSLPLTDLFLERTQVSADGIARLRQELPNCRIVWDGGTIAPGVPAAQPAP